MKPTCFCCGGGHYAKSRECPARNIKCHNCGKKGHFASLCKGPRAVAGAQAVHSMCVLSVGAGQLQAKVSVGSRVVDMVVDTGSPVTLLPRSLVPTDTQMQPPAEALQAYGGARLQVLGTCDVSMIYKGQKVYAKVYVVPRGVPIMGLDVMKLFGVNVVNNRVCHVSQGEPKPVSATPAEVGSGPAPIIGFQHKVTVNPDVQPVRQSLRRLPWSVRDQVRDRLAELERDGIIESVDAS